MMAIGRVNAHARQWTVREVTAKQGVPSQTRCPAPSAAHTIDQGARRKLFARTQVTHSGEASCVFHFRGGGGPLAFRPQQPRGSNETARFQTRPIELISRLGDPAKRLVVIEVVKFPFVAGVNAGQEFRAGTFRLLPGPLVEISVDDNFVA